MGPSGKSEAVPREQRVLQAKWLTVLATLASAASGSVRSSNCGRVSSSTTRRLACCGSSRGRVARGKSGEIRCQFIILRGNPVSVHHSQGKSGVSSSFSGEIRCQFIILRGNPVSVHHSQGKSGVSSSFLPEKTQRGNPVSVHHSCPKRRTDTGFNAKRRTDTGFRDRSLPRRG